MGLLLFGCGRTFSPKYCGGGKDGVKYGMKCLRRSPMRTIVPHTKCRRSLESNRNFFLQPSEKLDSTAGPFTIDEYLFIKMDKYASTVKMRQ
jgi:hypothetical protein